jgi:hypothetical protein
MGSVANKTQPIELPETRISSVTVIPKCCELAKPAGSPGQAAAAGTTSAAPNEAASATAAASAAATASAATASTASAAASGELYGGLERSLYGGPKRVFLVENVERRQADVGDFLFSERDLVPLPNIVHRRRIRDLHTGRCGCAPR